MPDALEEAVLSGALFRDGHTASLSEYRAEDRDTPSPTNTDDELGSDLDSPPPSTSAGPQAANGNPSSRTGVKGVIRDEREAKERARTAQFLKTRRDNEEMERRALLAGTYAEDERQRREDEERRNTEGGGEEEARMRRRETRRRELMDGSGNGGERRKGYLREVSLEGYLNGAEDDGWTVVLVYEPVSTPNSSRPAGALYSVAAA